MIIVLRALKIKRFEKLKKPHSPMSCPSVVPQKLSSDPSDNIGIGKDDGGVEGRGVNC